MRSAPESQDVVLEPCQAAGKGFVSLFAERQACNADCFEANIDNATPN